MSHCVSAPVSHNMLLVVMVLPSLSTACSSQATSPRHRQPVKSVKSPLAEEAIIREERTENYPKDVLTQIKQSPVLSGMFDSPVVGVSLLSSKTSGYSEDRGERICEAVTQLTTPRHERNTRGEMRWIVNQPDNRTDLTQVVKVTKCRVGGKCYDGSLSSRDRTFCRQEYMDHKLVALNSDNSQVIIDTFSFPSCCTCYVQERGYSWW